jgi:hypothetical protein
MSHYRAARAAVCAQAGVAEPLRVEAFRDGPK